MNQALAVHSRLRRQTALDGDVSGVWIYFAYVKWKDYQSLAKYVRRCPDRATQLEWQPIRMLLSDIDNCPSIRAVLDGVDYDPVKHDVFVQKVPDVCFRGRYAALKLVLPATLRQGYTSLFLLLQYTFVFFSTGVRFATMSSDMSTSVVVVAPRDTAMYIVKRQTGPSISLLVSNPSGLTSIFLLFFIPVMGVQARLR